MTQSDEARPVGGVDRTAPCLGVDPLLYYAVMHAIELALESNDVQEKADVPRAYRVNDYAIIAATAIENGRKSALHRAAMSPLQPVGDTALVDFIEQSRHAVMCWDVDGRTRNGWTIGDGDEMDNVATGMTWREAVRAAMEATPPAPGAAGE